MNAIFFSKGSLQAGHAYGRYSARPPADISPDREEPPAHRRLEGAPAGRPPAAAGPLDGPGPESMSGGRETSGDESSGQMNQNFVCRGLMEG